MYTGNHPHATTRKAQKLSPEDAIVIILSDDDTIRSALDANIHLQGRRSHLCKSRTDFLTSPEADLVGCVVLDARLPDLTASDLTHLIGAHAIRCPVIVLTGHGGQAMTVNATKFHVSFIPQPFDLNALAEKIHAAIRTTMEIGRLEGNYRTLTPREREVMKFVAEGLLNKQVAFKLNISEITVKAHRGQVMRKMNARTLPHLVNMAAKLDIGVAFLH
ncbi:response regulator transcription factor [Rhizobium leguminosarum]|uniref:response regulator transcription factor n=1 Tax=Rhizobium leguminosarum TaxID=384 RepID=UPI001031D356|nr:LuxR C-terminal-related transcriptional regulator [Rhizobium leguminosarum]TBF35174.1 response regulator transcription factor [Rhizobium leguminosarum]